MKYSGIDLHSNNSVVTVTDEEDRVVAEKRLPNDLAKILGFLMPWREELAAGVVVESTFNWYWLVDGLQAAGFEVHLANTMAIKKYEGLKHSGDETDARYLAHLLRLGILPTGTILPPEQRAVRDLARKRMQLVRSRTAQILAVENITARQRGARIMPRRETFGASFFDWDAGNRHRVAAFLRLAGVTAVGAGDDLRAKVAAKAIMMPSWPDPGWVAQEQDVTIIKFSDYTAPQKLQLCAAGVIALCK
ncbi:MAG: hypothetical protein DDT21_02392 [Syntrophomonadaceae bacterium]|nr:hypothetical protein [Bacillota bacterium]